jgi:hypothetical protein
LSYSGKKSVELMGWLYEDARIFLNRKYNKFIEYMKSTQ